MKTCFAALALSLFAASASADAFSELRRLGGPSAEDLAKVSVPAPVLSVAAPPAKPEPVRATSAKWNEKFPVARQAVLAAGTKAGTKAFAKWSCEYAAGAESARCDFAYDVWPEMCWYGFDHVVVDVDLKDPAKLTIVSRDWRAD